MGAIHIQWEEIEEAAMRGSASAGEVLAVRPAEHAVDVRVDQVFDRRLPERKGRLARLLDRLRRPRVAPPTVRTFAISPPPMATDPHDHPVFIRLAGALALADVAPGDRVFVVEAASTGLFRDDAATRTRLTAAFDRSADLAWASAATIDELHLGLLERRRADAAIAQLHRRRALDAAGLLARVPPERAGGLHAVVGSLGEPDRRAFVVGAARHLAATGNRAVLVVLVRSLFDFVRLHELEPLLLLLDRTRPEEDRLLEFARVRIGMILGDEPHRHREIAHLAAHVGFRGDDRSG
jgi:hypothetical protein